MAGLQLRVAACGHCVDCAPSTTVAVEGARMTATYESTEQSCGGQLRPLSEWAHVESPRVAEHLCDQPGADVNLCRGDLLQRRGKRMSSSFRRLVVPVTPHTNIEPNDSTVVALMPWDPEAVSALSTTSFDPVPLADYGGASSDDFGLSLAEIGGFFGLGAAAPAAGDALPLFVASDARRGAVSNVSSVTDVDPSEFALSADECDCFLDSLLTPPPASSVLPSDACSLWKEPAVGRQSGAYEQPTTVDDSGLAGIARAAKRRRVFAPSSPDLLRAAGCLSSSRSARVRTARPDARRSKGVAKAADMIVAGADA